MSNSAVTLLRSQFAQTKEILEGTMAGVTSEVAHKDVGGTVGTIAANAAHLLSGLDAFLLSTLTGNPPMLATSHADKHGMSEIQPQGDEVAEWYKSVKVDLEVLNQYGQDVFQAVDDHLAKMTDADLEEVVDMGSFGEQSRAWLCNIILWNTAAHTGEIAAIKGLQGLQGYPF